VLAERDYTYTDTSGADTGLRDSMTDPVTGTTTHYTYDGMNRLHTANDGATAYTATYDQTGNRTSLAQTGQASTYAAYNDADQLCWTATSSAACTAPPTGANLDGYDSSGNQTSAGSDTTTVNVFNQVSSIQTGGVTTHFTYADTSNTERISSAATNFINGTLGVTSQTSAGTTIEYTRDPAGNLISMSTAGTDYYYTADAIGSIILLTDPNQNTAATYTYNPFGLAIHTGSLADTNPWQYAGSYHDAATGLDKMGARYYNPSTGRFTQPDPSHQEQNNYTYAGDDPIDNTDPRGLGGFWNSVGDIVIGVAATVAVATICAGTGGIGCIAAGVVYGAAAATATGVLNGDSGWGLVQDGAVGGVVGGFAAGIGAWYSGAWATPGAHSAG